ncbi:hypothetical protein AYI68_g6979, partial [Smittium mucronatum]
HPVSLDTVLPFYNEPVRLVINTTSPGNCYIYSSPLLLFNQPYSTGAVPPPRPPPRRISVPSASNDKGFKSLGLKIGSADKRPESTCPSNIESLFPIVEIPESGSMFNFDHEVVQKMNSLAKTSVLQMYGCL